MVLVHKIVGIVLNPLFSALAALLAGLLFRRKRVGLSMMVLSLLMLAFLGMPVSSEIVATFLERDYPPKSAEDMPEADAIILLGGGIMAYPLGSGHPYPRLRDGADRVWHAARLYNAGKASVIYCTSPDVSISTPPFLKALGVPEEAIVALDGPRNTQEEAALYAEKLAVARVLLVTSAVHMKRAVKIFNIYAPNLMVIPAATDHRTYHCEEEPIRLQKWIPRAEGLASFNVVWHELLGLMRYTF